MIFHEHRPVKLLLLRAARKQLEAMPKADAAAILSKLKAVAADPFGNHPQAKKLANVASGYRLRHGEWRATYIINRSTEAIIVDAIKHRREVYR